MRSGKAIIDPFRPVAAFAEQELGPDGTLQRSATILIANRECPFRCIYCDLWKHTLDEPTPEGAVPRQIDVAFEELGSTDFDQVKLYNAGNWFDGKAIPETDYQAIADRLRSFKRVIIENHPKLCDERVLRFRDMLDAQLEIAIGVETIDDSIMHRLDKSMSVADADRAMRFLREADVAIRAFLLFPPPFQINDIVSPALEAIDWCFERGVSSSVLIPLRVADGAMPQLVESRNARMPTLEEIESAVERYRVATAAQSPGRLFVDLWDAEASFGSADNAAARIERLRRFNDTQEWT